MLHLWKMFLGPSSPFYFILGWEYETKDDDELQEPTSPAHCQVQSFGPLPNLIRT